MSFKKNTAVIGFSVGLVSKTDGSDITTGTPVGYSTLDGGAQTAIADVTPVHEGNGLWSFDLTDAEMNGDIAGLTFTHASAITAHFTIKTDTKIVSDIDALLGAPSGATVSDDIAEINTAVGNISVGSAAISKQAESYVLTVGALASGAISDTETLNGVYQIHNDAAGAIDFYYQFDVGGSGVGVEIGGEGYLTGANDSVQVMAWDWAGLKWDELSIWDGANSTANVSMVVSLLLRHTGSGANAGKVRLRFFAAAGLTTATLAIDQIFVSYSIVSQTVGYALGRVWINTDAANTNTESYVDGVADNPVSTLAAALTIANDLGIKDFNVSSNSVITLATAFNGYNLFGIGYSLDFNGFDVSGSHFFHASPVTGIALAGGDHVDIHDSIIQDLTANDIHFENCSFTEDILTMGAVSGAARIIDSRSIVAGSGTPTIDFGTSLADHNVTIADWQNGIKIVNYNANAAVEDRLSISGTGQIIIDATCSGNINLRGQWKVTNNSAGAVTITTDDVAKGVEDGAKTANLEARTLLAGDYFDPSVDAVARVTLVDTTTANTDMRGTNSAALASVATQARLSELDSGVVGKMAYQVDVIQIDTTTDIPATISALNDIAATDIVTNGAIATLLGAVVNVDTVDVNSDMRGTDGANTTAPNNAGISAILADTAEIGAAGSGLTDLGGMSAGMKAEVNAEADTAIIDYDPPTNAELEARTPTAAQLSYIVMNAATGMGATFSAGTTTTATLINIDGVAASSTDGQYNGRLIVFTSGTLKGVVTDITAYDGATKTATITGIPTAVLATHTARLI